MEAGVVRVSVILITRFWSSFDGALRESLSPMTAPTCAGMRRYAEREGDSLLLNRFRSVARERSGCISRQAMGFRERTWGLV